MARGDIAKDAVVKKIQEAFGDAYIGCYDKKHYVWAKEGGEKVQIALALTCPKVPVAQINSDPFTKEINFEEIGNVPAVAPTGFAPAEITEEETESLQRLMKELGL